MPRPHLRLAPLGFLLLGACATPPAPHPTLGVDPKLAACATPAMLDAASRRLRAICWDRGFSLARLVDERLGGRLDPNDRRLLDATLDQAVLDAPGEPGRAWTNPANGDAGTVDLKSWLVDSRRGEVCGIVGHEAEIGGERVAGTLTLCRPGGAAAGWRLDARSFEPGAAPRAESGRGERGRRTEGRAGERRRPAAGRPAERGGGDGAGEGGGRGTGGAGDAGRATGGGDGRAAPTVSEPCQGVPEGGGRANVGDCMQDRGPHVPATPGPRTDLAPAAPAAPPPRARPEEAGPAPDGPFADGPAGGAAAPADASGRQGAGDLLQDRAPAR